MSDEKKAVAKDGFVEAVKASLLTKELRLPPISDARLDVFRVGDDFRKRLQEMCQRGAITFHWNGHHKRRMTVPTAPPTYTWEFRKRYGLEEGVLDNCTHGFMHEDVAAAKKLLALFDTPGEYLPFMKQTYNAGCFQCGQDVELGFNGIAVKAINKCKYPDGMPPIRVTISVPSGKLVFVNYFDGVEPPSDNGRFDGALGYKFESKHYAKHNVAYGACGNSCPSVLLNAKKDKIIIGNVRHDENDSDKIIDGFDGYTRVGGVTTDLWAWSAADYDTARKIGWVQHKLYKDDVVKVVPGKYRVSQMFHMVDYDNLKIKHKFATIERIGR